MTREAAGDRHADMEDTSNSSTAAVSPAHEPWTPARHGEFMLRLLDKLYECDIDYRAKGAHTDPGMSFRSLLIDAGRLDSRGSSDGAALKR